MKPYFWMQSPGDKLPEPLTLEAVIEAESKLKVKLPVALIDLLMEQNGGSVRYDGFPLPEEVLGKGECLPICDLKGIDHTPDNTNTILFSPRILEGSRLRQDIVLIADVADANGHGWIALDYRLSGSNGEPSVVWVDEEIDIDKQLTTNFQSYIDQLVIYATEHVYGLSGDSLTPNYIIEELSKAFGTTFLKEEYGRYWKAANKAYRLYESIELEQWCPLFPECKWFIVCYIETSEREAVETVLARLPSLGAKLVHVPTCVETF